MRSNPLKTLAAASALALAACSSTPPAQTSPARPAPASASRSAFEQAQLSNAQALERDGRFAEAARLWEVLSLYRPDEGSYAAGLDKARRSAERAASANLAKAHAARSAGNEQLAVKLYLLSLANEPGGAEAAKALRELERARNRRYFLGKPTRLTIGRPDDYLTAKVATAEPSVDKDPGRDAGAQADDAAPTRGELEHAALLERDGEFTEALAMLARFVKAHPGDEQAREQLGKTWEAFGDNALAAGRPRAALRAFERARSYRPGASALLDPKIEALKRSLGQS